MNVDDQAVRVLHGPPEYVSDAALELVATAIAAIEDGAHPFTLASLNRRVAEVKQRRHHHPEITADTLRD